MTAIEREIRILEIVKENKIVSFKHLVKELGVPTTTLRRDLTRLDQEKKLVRFHGGAKAIEEYSSDYYEKQEYLDPQIKEQIGRQALTMLRDNETIFLDSGTTAYTLGRLITNKTVRIYTTSVMAAMDLSRRGMQVYLIGGRIQNNLRAIFGPEAVSAVLKKRFDKAFLATTAMRADQGFLTVYEEDAKLKAAVISRTDQTYVLASGAKFTAKAQIPFASPKDVILITDQVPEDCRAHFTYVQAD